MKIVVVKSCGGNGFTLSPSEDPQDVPDAIAKDLLRCGHAIEPKAAKTAAKKRETTTKREAGVETTDS